MSAWRREGKSMLPSACPGGANAAEVADGAARELAFAGKGNVFCRAGLGAGIGGWSRRLIGNAGVAG